jgi:hypothetical protein
MYKMLMFVSRVQTSNALIKPYFPSQLDPQGCFQLVRVSNACMMYC